MVSWFDEKDDVHTLLDHLGDKVPQSIAEQAKKELANRGWSEERIRNEEWKRMD